MKITESYIVTKKFNATIINIVKRVMIDANNANFASITDLFEIIYNDEILYITIHLSNLPIPESYDVAALSYSDDDYEKIDIFLAYNPIYLPFLLNDIILELKDTLYHEIEHFKQNVNDNVSFVLDSFINKDPLNLSQINKSSEYIEYLLDYRELFAHIRGFHAVAKSRGTNIDNVIFAFLMNRRHIFTNKNEINTIYNILIQFGTMILPNANWSKTYNNATLF